MQRIPETPAELSLPWLTMALQNSGIVKDKALVATRYEKIGDIEGFVAQIGRVYLEYDGPNNQGSTSLIAKMTTKFEGIRPLISQFGVYEREVRFYRELAPLIETKVPDCYYSIIDEPGERFVLLLEDMAPAEVGDQIAGCTLE